MGERHKCEKKVKLLQRWCFLLLREESSSERSLVEQYDVLLTHLALVKAHDTLGRELGRTSDATRKLTNRRPTAPSANFIEPASSSWRTFSDGVSGSSALLDWLRTRAMTQVLVFVKN